MNIKEINVIREIKEMLRNIRKAWESSGEETQAIVYKRARGKGGKYLADDKSTKDINEAWVDGLAPKKRSKKRGKKKRTTKRKNTKKN